MPNLMCMVHDKAHVATSAPQANMCCYASLCCAVLEARLAQAACTIFKHSRPKAHLSKPQPLHKACSQPLHKACSQPLHRACSLQHIEFQLFFFFIFFVQLFPLCKDGSFGGTFFFTLGQQLLNQCLVADFQKLGPCSCAGSDHFQASARAIWHVLDVGLVFPTTKFQR